MFVSNLVSNSNFYDNMLFAYFTLQVYISVFLVNVVQVNWALSLFSLLFHCFLTGDNYNFNVINICNICIYFYKLVLKK